MRQLFKHHLRMKNIRFQTTFRILAITSVLFTELATLPAQTNYYFYVQFANKNSSPYSLGNPSAFLSERAIARRAAFSIACDSTDLPVNPSYLQQIENIGIHVHSHSKWMNGATVILPDSSQMSLIRALPFVRFVEYTGKLVGAVLAPAQKAKTQANLDYGIASTQINQLSGKYLHDHGFRGKGIQIGVIDAGFLNANTNTCFDSLRLQGRLLGTKDIINPTSNIYAEDAHGAMVLSIMAGNLPGQYLGTAPEASYWLIRTEYGPTEYKVETDFWCSGIEFADSVGVDVVNSSLGYYTFDDPTMGFTYADMNGKVSRASRAANLASKKGIIVVVAAGNEGASSWHYIGSPADAEGIIAVGAVKADSTSSPFSSFGPSSDNRVKPEICAIGSSSAIVSTSGVPSYGNGTSFASPTMAGMMACYLQAVQKSNPALNMQSILKPVLESGNLYLTPTTQKGYGIPNFEFATRNLSNFAGLNPVTTNDNYLLAYDAKNKAIQLWSNNRENTLGKTVRLYSVTGKLVVQKQMTEAITAFDTHKLPVGIYAICITGNGKTETKKITIQ
jgi:serine protease AprX